MFEEPPLFNRLNRLRMWNSYIRFTTTALVILSLVRAVPAQAIQDSAQQTLSTSGQTSGAPSDQTSGPAAVGMSPATLARLDEIIDAEIAKKQLPGAVVIVSRKGKIV